MTDGSERMERTERTILDFMDRVLPEHFQGRTWWAWRCVLRAAFGLPLGEHDLAVYRALTGRTEPPDGPCRELWAVVGRRGGKSQIAALIAVYLATCRSYPLAAGERGVLPIIAADRRQARVVAGYVKGLLHSTPVLEGLIERELRESVELSNSVTIEIHTASYRTTRGYTCIGAVCDEIAFWPTDESAAEPDRAILDALRPAMSTIPGALLLCLSTPYARRGELHHAVEHHHGEDGDVLVVMADTLSMNPGVDRRLIARAFERDRVAAMSEYGDPDTGEIHFRSDVSALLTEEAIAACVPDGITELPPDPNRRAFAHYDAATGSGKDAAALAIAFAPTKTRPAELALVRQWRPPFSPSSVIAEAADLLKQYGLSDVQIDRMAINLIAESFREHSITASLFELDTSASFVGLLTVVNSKRVRLLDHPALLSEIRRLERRSTSGGRDKVGHPPGGHDDVAAAASGALMQAVRQHDTSMTWGTPGKHFRPDLQRRVAPRGRGRSPLLDAFRREQARQRGGNSRGTVPDRLAQPSTDGPNDPFARENRFR